jgi:hypothetical protein
VGAKKKIMYRLTRNIMIVAQFRIVVVFSNLA